MPLYSSSLAENTTGDGSQSSAKASSPQYNPGVPTDEESTGSASYAQNSHTAILEAVIEVISQRTDRLQILKGILPYALALAEAESGALLVIDGGVEEAAPDLPLLASISRAGGRAPAFVGIARQGLPEELMKELTRGELADLLRQGQVVYLRSQALQLNPQQALLGRYKLRYLLAIPLQGDEVLGAIVVASRRSGSSLLPPELQQRVVMLARLVALFLENARLHMVSQMNRPAEIPLGAPAEGTEELEELLAAVMSAEEEVVNHNRDLGILNALTSEVSSTLQLSAVLQKAIERTLVALNADAGWIYFFEDGALTLIEEQGLSERYVQEMKRLKLGDGVEGMAFSRNEPFLRDALLFHSGRTRNLVEAEKIRAVAAVPLRSQGKPFGVLAVASHKSHDWSSRDERMLMSIGQQVAQAIYNSQLFAQAQSKAQNWEANYNALQQANSQLARRAEALERQIEELQRIEQQIWTALAASQAARRRFRHGLTITDTLSSPRQTGQPRRKNAYSQIDKQLASTLRRVLDSLKRNK